MEHVLYSSGTVRGCYPRPQYTSTVRTPYNTRGFLGIFPAGFFPRFCTGFGVIPWSRDKCEIPFPHKRVPRKFLYPVHEPAEKCKSRSRTNASRANKKIPFPHIHVPHDSGYIPNPVNTET
ncbi:unnamed protein product [Laminaria digitata]